MLLRGNIGSEDQGQRTGKIDPEVGGHKPLSRVAGALLEMYMSLDLFKAS